MRSLLEKIQAKQQFLLNAIPSARREEYAGLAPSLRVRSRQLPAQSGETRVVNSFAEFHDQGLWMFERCIDASHCHFAFVIGRTGFEKCCTNPGDSILAQLG